jgi:hypothetical protein
VGDVHKRKYIEMAMGTRTPSTRRVLPDDEAGMELYFHPRVHKWATSCTRRVSGCGFGYILPIPAGKINPPTICDECVKLYIVSEG